MLNLNLNDSVVREFPALTGQGGREIFPAGRQVGKVSDISENVITAVVQTPDGPSIMRFSRATGVSVHGEKHGRITREPAG